MSAISRDPQPRIASLDLVRGFALLGILAVNVQYYAAPWQNAINPLLPPLSIETHGAQAWALMHIFFEGKCIALFSMLFGASLYLVGGEQGERDAILTRRLAWLALFGALHGALLWYGDILLPYAIAGACVMFARSWSAGTLARTGFTLFALSMLLSHILVFAIDALTPEQITEVERLAWRPSDAEILAATTTYRGGFFAGFRENAEAWWSFVSNGILSLGLRNAAMMMFGLALLKAGFFGRLHRLWYLAALVAGLASLALIAWQAQLNMQAGFGFRTMQFGMLINNILAPVAALGYAAALVLSSRTHFFSQLIDALSAAGRLALTNYIAQTLIMVAICRVFGLYGALSREQLWGIVLLIWLVQLTASTFYLKRHKIGPLEWLWRRLTYNQPIALR